MGNKSRKPKQQPVEKWVRGVGREPQKVQYRVGWAGLKPSSLTNIGADLVEVKPEGFERPVVRKQPRAPLKVL